MRYEISDNQAVLFFQQLKNDLDCSSYLKIAAIVRVIFSKLKGSYTGQQITEIIAKSPPLFHLVFKNTEYEKKEIGHLDELVDTLYLEDAQGGHGLFKSEIETLRTVTVVLRSIERLFKPVGIQAFNYTLGHELQQAVQGETGGY